MDTLQIWNKKEIKGGLGADATLPARNITSKPPHRSPSVCVCVCVFLHALIALAHHDAAQNAANEPTLWFPEGAMHHLLHAPNTALTSCGQRSLHKIALVEK